MIVGSAVAPIVTTVYNGDSDDKPSSKQKSFVKSCCALDVASWLV